MTEVKKRFYIEKKETSFFIENKDNQDKEELPERVAYNQKSGLNELEDYIIDSARIPVQNPITITKKRSNDLNTEEDITSTLEFKCMWEEKLKYLEEEIKYKMIDSADLTKNMTKRLKPIVEEELKREIADNITAKIKEEIQLSLTKEFNDRKEFEMEKIRKKFDLNYTKKVNAYSNKLRQSVLVKLQPEYDELMERRIQELKEHYQKQLIEYKKVTKAKLTSDFEAKNAKLFQEYESLKQEINELKSHEKEKLSYLNSEATELIAVNNNQIKNHDALRHALREHNLVDPSPCNKSEFLINNKRVAPQSNQNTSCNNNVSNNNSQLSFTNNFNHDPLTAIYEDNSHPDNISNSANLSKKDVSQEDEDKDLKSKDLEQDYYCFNVISQTMSTKVTGLYIPLQFELFKDFVQDYIIIEKEYKQSFLTLKNKVLTIIQENLSLITNSKIYKPASFNHNPIVLIDYIMEIWGKLDISYKNRYLVFEHINKLSFEDMLRFLDEESSGLTTYYKNVESTLNLIRLKEELKFNTSKTKVTRLQDNSEKIEDLNLKIQANLNKLKQDCDLVVVWKGIPYEYLLTYEVWLKSKSQQK